MTSSSTSAANNPTLPAPLNQGRPQSQAEWQQILNQLLSWQQGLGTLIPPYQQTAAEVSALAVVTTVPPINYSYLPHSSIGGCLLERYGGGITAPAAANDAAFAMAVLVSGQVDCPIFITAGPGTWQFSKAWVLTGTGQGFAGVGPPVVGSGTTGCRVIGLHGRPLIQFTSIAGSIGASTDCITVGGANVPQVELRNLQIDFNRIGRDGLVNNGSNMPIYDNLLLENSFRDAEVQSVSGTNFIEKGTFHNVQVRSAGRHAQTRALSGSGGAFINEGVYVSHEIRGVSTLTAGGAALYMTSTASAGGSKFANSFYSKFNWDAGFTPGNPTPCESPILIDSGTCQNLIIGVGGWENAATASYPSTATTSTSGTGTVATIGFAALPVAPAVGSLVIVSGVTPAGYNGTYTITASTTSSVSFASATTGAQSVAGVVAFNGYYNKIVGSGAMGGFAILPGCLTNSFWSGSSGVHPATSGVTVFDNSFNRTFLMGPANINNTAGSGPDLTLQGNTTAGSASDLLITRIGAAGGSPSIGVGANVTCENLTSATAYAIQEWNGNVIIYSLVSGLWTEICRVVTGSSGQGGVRIAGLSTVYSCSGGPPSAGLGANGDYAFRQDTPGTANQRLYVKSGGAWTGIV